MGLFDYVRKSLWHVRHGGLTQVKTYWARAKANKPNNVPQKIDPHNISPFPIPHLTPQRHLRVGIIADAFTELAFSFEWQQVKISPAYTGEDLEQLDLLFVESAWHGNDDQWQYQLTGSTAPSTALINLVNDCKAQGIPTVFWNKEDPFHFADFLRTARLFDWVYTTDADLLSSYQQELGHSRIGVLQFAAQPAIHNPSGRPKPHILRDTCFAGTYFHHKFPERQAQMDLLLAGANLAEPKLSNGIDIYARFHKRDPNYNFPQQYQRYVRGELSYEQMLNAYRSYASFLNVNSIVGSPSMFSRRVFELLACATPVISTPSLGIRATLGDAVVQVESAESAAHWIRAFSYSANLREEYGYYGQMKVLSAHTYSHRVDDILNDLGLTEHTVGMPGVSVLLATNRPHQLRHAFEQCARQRGVETELLVCANGFDVTAEHYALAEKFELSPRWIKPQHEDTLGDYYNLLLRHARFPVVAKIDDDDIYGAYYLLEQVTALRTMNADLVGKKSHIVRFHGGVMNEADEANSLPGVDALPYRDAVAFDGAEHQFVSFVPGPTMVMTASLAQELGFDTRNRGEDTAFIHKAIGAGAKIWSTSRFGFVQNRFVSGHTWQSDPVHILAHSRMIGSEYYVN